MIILETFLHRSIRVELQGWQSQRDYLENGQH
jgi:hypothetical protein